MGISAWIMLSLLMISAIFLGYFVMCRLLRQGAARSSRHFAQKRRVPRQHLPRRRILKYR
jgi:hypothetical protein